MEGKNPEERYRELAEKWLNGTITPAEAQEYAQWFNRFDPEESLEVPADLAANREAHREKILAAINRRRRRVIRFSPSWYKVAAAVFFLLLGGGYFFLRQNAGPDLPIARQPAEAIPQDIQAGTTGAVLTLANGQTIVLDTAGNGRLFDRSGVAVVKSNSSIAVSATAHGLPATAEYNLLVTPRARQQQLVLSDGTRVWLNAESSIRFPTAFTGRRREVEITGEAYFEVAKDPARPFVVNVDQSTVEVLGTHFNIMAYRNEAALETTLLEGSVRFSKGRRSVLLKPGGQSRLLAGEEIRLVPDADVELAIAWKNGLQAFEKADLKTIMRQVERWYDVDVEFRGAVPSRTFSGEIPRTASLSELLKLFEAAKIHFTIDATRKKLTVIP